MTVTLFEARRPPVALLVGGSEGGMKRVLAVSYDVTNGAVYRETVLRMSSMTEDYMRRLPRVRLGLRNPRTVENTRRIGLAEAMGPPLQDGVEMV
jgi:hypothetical protein